MATVEVVVDTLGRPEVSTMKVAQASDSAFGLALLAAVPALRWSPAVREGSLVRQAADVRVLRKPMFEDCP